MKVAVITGGASGIGLATGKRLKSMGCEVVLVDWSDNVESIALENGLMGIKCDVSNEEDVKHCILEVIKKYNHIDYLVANAGIGGSASLPHEVSLEEWNKVIGVNQTGIFLINKYVISEMLKTGGGSIVNTSSMYGLVGTNMSFAYSASKGAINQITRSWLYLMLVIISELVQLLRVMLIHRYLQWFQMILKLLWLINFQLEDLVKIQKLLI